MDNYEDIINLPHPVSRTQSHISMMIRAAQYSSFAALTGHDDVLEETACLTDSERELGEIEEGGLNEKIAYLQAHIDEYPLIVITHFVHDARKAGGAFVQTQGKLKSIDNVDQVLVMNDGTTVPLYGIMDIEIIQLM